MEELTRLCFSFQGRINRAKYWLVVLVISAIFVAFVLIAAAAQSWALGILAALLFIPTLVASLAITVKRLHDREKSAWWLLVFYLLPSVLEGAGKGMEETAVGEGWASLLPALVLLIAAIVLSIWAFVELGCLRGTIGENRYGPDPLEGRG
jgi:uncharacterized membrane protein YhaH (DUF805 family)